MGLNSDASVKRLKGESRPVNSELDRKFVLENLRAIDYVFIFEEDTPYNLIEKIQPDILVKGGDWKPEDIIGSDIVLKKNGEVKSLNFVNGFSTTSTIEKINKK
jgi:rfaE bifunctional protein nucleotidyltransferase chain/domain